MKTDAGPVFFATGSDFRKWLIKNHTTFTELVVGYYKVNSGKASMTWSESVDEALCFGWIDGVRSSIDDTAYSIRFTPRRTNSIWSAVNIKKIEELTQKGLMQEAGLKIFSIRKESKSRIYSFEQESVELLQKFELAFKSNMNAWTYFNSLAPSYKKAAIHWVMTAKQEVTTQKRMNQLIEDSNEGRKLKHLSY